MLFKLNRLISKNSNSKIADDKQSYCCPNLSIRPFNCSLGLVKAESESSLPLFEIGGTNKGFLSFMGMVLSIILVGGE